MRFEVPQGRGDGFELAIEPLAGASRAAGVSAPPLEADSDETAFATPGTSGKLRRLAISSTISMHRSMAEPMLPGVSGEA